MTKSLLLLLLSLTEFVSFSIKFKFGDPNVVYITKASRVNKLNL